MTHALPPPGLGYYAAGNTKFGSDLPGDFTTAPELTPFGRLANSPPYCRHYSSLSLERVGALAEAMIPVCNGLSRLQNLNIGDLQERQKTAGQLGAKIEWVNDWPDTIKGCVIANEVLDAMPATLFQWDTEGSLLELGVRTVSDEHGTHFEWATCRTCCAACCRQPTYAHIARLPVGNQSAGRSMDTALGAPSAARVWRC